MGLNLLSLSTQPEVSDSLTARDMSPVEIRIRHSTRAVSPVSAIPCRQGELIKLKRDRESDTGYRRQNAPLKCRFAPCGPMNRAGAAEIFIQV